MADPASPAPEPPPVPSGPKTFEVSEGTGLPRNIAAALSLIFPLVGGVVFLVLERKDRFVRFYAVQSILSGAAVLLVWISVEIVDFIFRHIPLLGGLLIKVLYLVNLIFSLAWFVVWVVAIYKAFSGREWEIPYLGNLARRQLGVRMP